MRRTLAALVLLAACGPLAADLIVHVRSADGKIVASIAVPPGGYADVVERGTTPTPPGPQPPNPPNPPPNPPPQPPPVGPARYLMLIYDSTPGRMTSAQLAALADADLRAKIKAAGLLYSEFPVDSDEVQLPPVPLGSPPGTRGGRDYQKKLLTPNGLTAPCLVLADPAGRFVRGTPLPADATGIANFIQGK